MRAVVLAALLAGCASFEDPTIVLDLRVIAMETEPPEQILDIDPDDPPTFDELLQQLQPIRVRAIVADPGRLDDLVWTMEACVLEERGSRCDGIGIDFAGGLLEDPENASVGVPCDGELLELGGVVCGRMVPDNRFVQLLAKALDEDPARGLGGIDLGFVLRVQSFGEGDTKPRAEAFAAKHVRFAARVPAERVPNQNPHIDQLLIGRAGFGADVRLQHCNDRTERLRADTVFAGETVTLFPVSREGDKEEYVLPTLDGGSEHFTEYLSYQWVATHGTFSEEMTGGPPDIFGNVKLEGTEWTAPGDFSGHASLWVVQRDPRYGARWREACINVVGP